MQINKVYSENINCPYSTIDRSKLFLLLYLVQFPLVLMVISLHNLFLANFVYRKAEKKGPNEILDHQRMFLKKVGEMKHLFENVFEDLLLISNVILVQNTIASSQINFLWLKMNTKPGENFLF